MRNENEKSFAELAEFLIDVLMTAPFLVKWKFRGAMPLNFHVGVGICLISRPLQTNSILFF